MMKEFKNHLRVGHSLCSSTADEIKSGAADDHVRPEVSILTQKNQVHKLESNCCEIHFNIIFPSRPTFF
jgi:hypothetical protein